MPSAEHGTPILLSGGKVVMRKLSELPAQDRAEYGKQLATLQATSAELANTACIGVTAFCSVNVDELFFASLSVREKKVIADTSSVRLSVGLVPIMGSKFSSLTYMGLIPDGLGDMPPWSAVSRIFKDRDANTIQISEWDFVSDGGGVLVLEEFQNVKVGPFRGSMIKNMSSTGKVVWQVSWVEMRKKVELTLLCANGTKCVEQEAFLSLANSLYLPLQ